MKRVNYHLTNDQIAWLEGESKRTGAPVAALIRRAIDDYRAARETPRLLKPAKKKKGTKQ